MRRRNAVVVLATQQISDIANSPIADTVFAQTVTKILLPNPEATNIDNAAFYARLGLNSTEISMIQRAIPKSEYYVTCANGRRMIDLALGQVALAFTSVNGPTGRAKAEALMRAHPNTWQGHWLVLRGREAGDANLIEWGNNLIQELEGEPLCVLSAQRA
jgi:type IV secretion system protein VirB4